MTYKPGVCNFCGTGCGHNLRVEDGSITGVFASPGHPVGKGRLCVRGWHIHELIGTGERILHPLVRKNGRLEKVSLDEALDLVADRLGGFPGAETAFWASPRASNEDIYALVKLARSVLGSNNISLLSDDGHREAVDVLGQGTGFPAMPGSVADIAGADFLLVVGSDITRQNPIIGSELHLAARGGADLITLGGRRTQIAELSRTHLQNRPGTAALVLAAMAAVLVEEGRIAADTIPDYTAGFEVFAESLKSLDMATVEKLTGLALEDIRGAARRLAGARRAMAFFSSGISGLDRNTIAMLHNLFLAAGHAGRNGSGVNPITGICNIVGGYDMGAVHDLWPGYAPIGNPAAKERLNSAWGPLPETPAGFDVDGILADPGKTLKALVVMDHDEDAGRHAERIRGLDFVVYTGAFVNPFAEFAHVVLPAASYAETDGTFTNTERRIQLNRAKTEAPPDALPAWRIFSEIAARRERPWNFLSCEDVMREIAATVPAYAGVTYEKLEQAFGLQWPCDADRPLSFIPAANDFRVPETSDEYPFLLMTGQAEHFWHRNTIMKLTQIPMREYNALLLLYPEGFVEISAVDAARLRVRDKHTVSLTSAAGTMRAAARVSETVKPGTAYVPYFLHDSIVKFLAPSTGGFAIGEDGAVPVRIEKV